MRSITNQFDARACRTLRQGADRGRIRRGKGGCQCLALGWPGVRIAGESAGQRG
ncbi:hypothetical protein SGL43_03289 [Streptomyces globisporus]|uniref:Uncharacterized protein n=1 Tax=Streptomyces globisporus TaxID=1908 RepID=A0ABM9GYL0_STRGL|nr:hypothetical protein SGL43_03289 [Streptomyces globisporus]